VAFVEPSLFWLCAFLAAGTGAFLAFVDDSEPKVGGSGPTAHLSDCADSADKLFAGLACDGVGLGLLEPLWRLFTPDGALWTLLTLGLGGLAASAGKLCAAAAGLARTAGRAVGVVPKEHSPAKAHKGVPSSLTHEKTKMSFLVEAHAYWGYFRLFMMGVVREYIVRTYAAVLRDPLCRGYVVRERWNSGWVDFYKQHMYKLYVDCFNRPISSAPDATVDVVVRSRPGGTIFGPLHDFEPTEKARKCINLSSYNYLGFGGVDEFCTPVARKAALETGFSASGTRTEGGTLPVHRQLEREVAKFLNKEDAIVLGMGFATNSTILPCLFEAGGKGVLVLSDALNHRSIVEGVRLSGATVRAFEHNSMPALEAQLKRAVEEGQPDGKPWRKVFVVVEGIYSMEGDFCRLREIVTLKNRYKAYLYLDEAHSIGAVGPNGRGVTELFGVPTSEVDVMMGTFTKSFGSAGGYVAASRAVINALRAGAPGSVFGAAMAPPCAAQALQALRVISGEEGGSLGAEKLRSIRDNSNFFREALDKEGFKVLGDVDSPIVPVMLHHPQKMAWFSRECLDQGIAVVVVGYPAVPVLYERVRFCISAAHTRDQLAKVVAQVTEVGRNVGVLFDKNTEKSILESRAVRAAEYAAWLRKAPVQRFAEADTAECAKSWTPQPLAPPAPQGLAAAKLAAALDDAPRGARDFRLFDPLGYSAKPAKASHEAMEATMDHYGFGACGPRGFYGTSRPHLELEAKLASFLKTEAAIAYSAGVATASSVLPALVQPGDRVIIDCEAHLGLRTGLRLCKAEVTWTPHGDLKAIEAALQAPPKADKKKKDSADSQRTFIVVEGLNQRTGQLAALPELLALKEKYGALLILEESLSFGVLGTGGGGLCEHFGVETKRVDAIVGSLEHTVAGVGGFCAGRKGLVDHQRLSGAGYCFSASCPPSGCSGAVATITALDTADGAARAEQLRANVARLHKGLQAVAAASNSAVELVSSPESYVQHLRWCGEAAKGDSALLAVAEGCAATEGGVRVQVCAAELCSSEAAFGARLGAPKACMPSLRLCASTEHSPEDIAAACATLQKALAASSWKSSPCPL